MKHHATSFFYFEGERLKPTVSAFLNNGCDFEEVPQALRKQMRVYMHEDIPNIWLSDGYHFMEAQFTKDAINDFRKNNNTIKFSSLREKILIITKWRLIQRQEDSNTCFTSYQNQSVHILVEQFRPWLVDNPAPRQVKHSQCLFRDADIQGLIRNRRHQAIQRDILGQHFNISLSDFKMPSAKDIFASEKQLKLQEMPPPIDDSNDSDQLMLEDEEKDLLNEERERKCAEVRKYNASVLTQISQTITQSEVIRCQLTPVTKEEIEGDLDDFAEFQSTADQEEEMKMVDVGGVSSTEQRKQYLRRLQIQERGEEDYQFLIERKGRQLQDKLEDERIRHEDQLNFMHFYQSKDRQREGTKLIMKKKYDEKEFKIRQRKVIRYQLGYSASQIKDKMMRFMATFRQDDEEDKILEENFDQTVEPRGRAYSQENIARNDCSEMIETRTNHLGGGGYAFSQYVYPQSVFNDGGDETQSEQEEDFDPIAMESRQRKKHALAQVQPPMALYKRYIEWFANHDVMKQKAYEDMQESIRRAAQEAAEREAEELRIRLYEEQLEREREEKRIQAEQYRMQQAELERQRKAESKLLRQKQLEEEKLRKQQEFEEERARRQAELDEQEREHQRLIDRERERKEREQREWEEQERFRLEKEKAIQEAKQREEERRAREEQEAAEERKRQFQLQKERLKREIEESNRQAEEKRLKKEQERLERIRIQEEELKRQQEEQERAEAEAEALRQEKAAEEAQRAEDEMMLAMERAYEEARKKAEMLAEQERLRQAEKKRLLQEAADKERLDKQAAEDKIKARQIAEQVEKESRRIRLEKEARLVEEERQRAAEAERQRVIAEKAEKERLRVLAENIEKERIRLEAAEHAEREKYRIAKEQADREIAERERLRIAKEKADAENAERQAAIALAQKQRQELLRRQQEYAEKEKAKQQAAAESERLQREMEERRFQEAAQVARQQVLLQGLIDNDNEDSSSCQSPPQNEQTPAFQKDPSDYEGSQNVQSQSSLRHDQTCGDQLSVEEHSNQKVYLQEPLSSQEEKKVNSKKRKRVIESEEEDSESQSSKSESESSQSSASENSSDVDSSEDSDSSMDLDPKALLKIAQLFSKSKKSKGKKDKKKDKKSKSAKKHLLAQMLAAIAGGKHKSSKKQSPSKHNGSKHSSSEKSKKRSSEKPSKATPFSLENTSVQRQTEIANKGPQRLEEPLIKQAHSSPIVVAKPVPQISPSASLGQTSFDQWKQQLQAPKQQTEFINRENIPDNGQRGIPHSVHLGQHSVRAPMFDHSQAQKPIASYDDTKNVIKEIDELAYLAGLGQSKKRPKYK